MTLQQLKEGKPKYDFLTSISDYAKENYGEIINELNKDNINEIIWEVLKDDSKKNIYYVSNDKTIEEIYGYCPFTVCEIECTNGNKSFEDRWIIYNGSYREGVRLDELYFINNYEKYYDYLNDIDEKAKQTAIERYESRINDRNTLLEKSKKYNISIPDEDKVKQLELIEKIKSQNSSIDDSLEAFKKLAQF